MLKTALALLAALLSTGAIAQEGTTARLVGPVSRSEYPLALGDRPLVLPNLMLEGTTDFEHIKYAPGITQSGIGLRAGIGVGDLAQIDVSSAIIVDPSSDWSKSIGARVGVLAYDTRNLDVAPSVFVPFDFADNHDLLSRAQVGAETRLRVNHIFYVYGLRDLLELGWGKDFGDELNAGLNATLGVGIEPIDHVSLELETTVVHAKVAGALEKTQWIFNDVIPVGAKVLFAWNRNLDVLGEIAAPDLKNGFDKVAVLGGLNFRL